MERYKSIFNNKVLKEIDELYTSVKETERDDILWQYQPTMPVIHKWMFFEAVIDPKRYLQEIKLKLYEIKNKNNIIGKNLDLTTLSNLFTQGLSNYKIKFFGTSKKSKDNKYVTSGGTNVTKEMYINIYCYYDFLQIQEVHENYKEMVKQVINILGHELIHREQILNVKNDELRQKIFKGSMDDLSSIEKYKKYLSKIYEIMAYAWQITDSFKIRGLDNKKIKNLLQSSSNKKFVYNRMLLDYHKYFGITTNVLKRLYKYMYEYLEL